jgi:hypothetical protein
MPKPTKTKQPILIYAVELNAKVRGTFHTEREANIYRDEMFPGASVELKALGEVAKRFRGQNL